MAKDSIRKTAKKLIKDKKNWTAADVAYAKMIRKKEKKWLFRYFRHLLSTVILNLDQNS